MVFPSSQLRDISDKTTSFRNGQTESDMTQADTEARSMRKTRSSMNMPHKPKQTLRPQKAINKEQDGFSVQEREVEVSKWIKSQIKN